MSHVLDNDIIDKYIQEIKNILDNDSSGIRFSGIFERMKSIDSEQELAKIIHRAVELKICAKINGFYYPCNRVTIVPESVNKHVTEEIKSLIPTVPVFLNSDVNTANKEPEHKTFTAKNSRTFISDNTKHNDKIQLPHGRFQTNGVVGKLAYALWRCRGENISRQDVKLILGDSVTSGARYQAIATMVRIGMCSEVIDHKTKESCLTWSGNFCYPFSRQQSSDKTLLPFNNHEEFLSWKDKTLSHKNKVVDDSDNNQLNNFSISKTTEVSQESKHIPTESPPDGVFTGSLSIDQGLTAEIKNQIMNNVADSIASNIEKPIQSNLDTIQLIDMRIKFHEAELFFLNMLKNNLRQIDGTNVVSGSKYVFYNDTKG